MSKDVRDFLFRLDKIDSVWYNKVNWCAFARIEDHPWLIIRCKRYIRSVAKMLNKFHTLLISPYYSFFILLLSVIGYSFGDASIIAAMIVLVQLVALTLCLSDDLAPTLLPILSLIVLGTTLIGRMELMTPWIPCAYTLIPAVVLHFVWYRKYKALRVGPSFYALLGTAAAILLGGIGNLASIDFSSPIVWYYLLMMSVGLVALYLLFASEVKREKSYDQLRYFLLTLVFIGVLCTVVIGKNFFTWVLGSEKPLRVYDYFLLIPYRNVIANLLLLCLPAPFYFAGYTEDRLCPQILYFSVGFLFFGAMLLTAARAALVFGGVMLLCCLVYYLCSHKKWYCKLINFLVVVAGLTLLVYFFHEPILQLISSRLEGGVASPNEARWKLLLRSFEDFRDHPFFGIGFCSSQNADVYSAEGCVSWYHLYFPQIWGSLGLFGCVTFFYQLLVRARLALYKPSAKTVALVLCYLGIFFYSQFDPGEFVPIPFAALAVLMFVYLERHCEENGKYRIYKKRK